MSDPFLLALGNYYSDHVLRGKPPSLSAQSLKTYVESSDEAKERARQRLNDLSKLDASCGGNLAKRCYVSHVQMKALQEALT